MKFIVLRTYTKLRKIEVTISADIGRVYDIFTLTANEVLTLELFKRPNCPLRRYRSANF